MEYNWIKNGTILDEKAEEIYVCSQYIQIYSLEGKYKRTLKIDCFDHDMKIIDYNDESLLIYDDVVIEPGREKQTVQTPYRFVSKKDGSTLSTLAFYSKFTFSQKKFQCCCPARREWLVPISILLSAQYALRIRHYDYGSFM